MARQISDEQKVQINELYYKIGVKSKVAKMLGISPSSVSKYIINGYIPIEKRKEGKFREQPKGFSKNILDMKNGESIAKFLIQLSSEEWDELKELQKGIFI